MESTTQDAESCTLTTSNTIFRDEQCLAWLAFPHIFGSPNGAARPHLRSAFVRLYAGFHIEQDLFG